MAMIMAHPETAYERYARLLNQMAWRVLRRCHAAGARSMQLEDILSELNLAWCIARERWNPETGVPFAAYLARGCWNHINRWVKGEIGDATLAPYSLDHTYGNGEDDGEVTLQNFVADTARPADEVLAEAQIREQALAKLSPRARQFYELLENPPPELIREIDAVAARAAYARSRGINAIAPPIAAQIIALMGCSETERTRIYSEIRAIGEVIQQ